MHLSIYVYIDTYIYIYIYIYIHTHTHTDTHTYIICILSIVKQITSPGGMHETGARAWCTGKTQRNQMEREVGRGIGMGNTCNSMADSCHCMTKPSEIL